MKDDKKCYWCGNLASTKEHVPPKNLFPKGYRNNLITVPSCDRHNTGFSKLDERFKIYLQAAMKSNAIGKEAFKKKTVRGLQREKSKKFLENLKERIGIQQFNNQPNLAIELLGNEQLEYLEKITRGLYYVTMGEPAINGKALCFCIQIYNENFPYNDIIPIVLELLSSPFIKEGNSENKEIFHYRYAGYKNEGFVVAFFIYENIECVGVITFDE